MKTVTFILIFFCLVSCKENNNSIENLFRKNLIQTSEKYENLNQSLINYYQQKNSDFGTKDEKLELIILKKQKLDKFINEIQSENKENQILKYESFIKDINKNNDIEFIKIELANLENLSDKTSFYFIKNDLYQNLNLILTGIQENYSNPYCGYTIHTEEKQN